VYLAKLSFAEILNIVFAILVKGLYFCASTLLGNLLSTALL